MIIHHLASAILMVVLAGSVPGSDMEIKIRTDPDLVAPGIGAEGIVLKDASAEIYARMGYPDRVVVQNSRLQVFSEIFGQKPAVDVSFDKIYYYESKRFIVFLFSGRVSAIAGLNRNRVTSDSVSLNSGVDYFIFRYGNEGLQSFAKGKNRLYIYPRLGMALADDGGDNEIDMFIVFEPLLQR